MQQKHHIDMMLFGEIIPRESESQVEDNVSLAPQFSIKVEETETDRKREAETKKEALKEKEDRSISRGGSATGESSHYRA